MSKQKQQSHVLQWILALVFFAAGNFLVGQNAREFLASVIPVKPHPPYDGLVAPIQKVPNWAAIDSAQWKMHYEQIPTDKLTQIPLYDSSQLKTPVEQLGWINAADLAARNAKITFTTPYMGNYKLDGMEYAGSHPAIDIKVPVGTPVYSIGNGVLVKVSLLNSGFGNHLVIRHDNFPSFNNASTLTTYYSSYSHLGSVLVSEGSVVLKGQQIALSGQSGAASTPHVHFQIDNDQAPWHPYWPYTYQEANAADLSWSEAINAGLGKEKALATTINPMLYVQKYLNGTVLPITSASGGNISSSVINGATSTYSGSTTTPTATILPMPAVAANTGNTTAAPDASVSGSSAAMAPNSPAGSITTAPLLSAAPARPQAAALKIITNDSFFVGTALPMRIEAVDAQSRLITDYKPKNGISLMISLGGATLQKNFFFPEDFINGAVNTTAIPTAPQGLRFKATDGEISAETPILTMNLFSDVTNKSDIYNAISFLKNYEVIGGYTDGSFKPQNTVSRVEALKFILKGTNKNLEETGRLPFRDTKVNEWYADYVGTAYKNSIVNGYPDRTFKPSRGVNRAEFLKMLLLAMNVKPEAQLDSDIFSDVAKNAWYAPYVKYAKDKNLMDSADNKFRPEEAMTRAEVAETIYRTIVLKLSGQPRYFPDLVVSGVKAQEYFAARNS